MSKAICSKCGCPVEIADGEEWGYCPMCENDQVEVKIGNSNGDFVDLLNKEMYELKIADLEAKLAEKEHTINTLIEDHKASQEWYKMQLADTEAQNKRVLEKLDIIVRSNQELEKQHDIDNQVIQLMEDNREKDKISFTVEQLRQVQKYIITDEKDMFGMPYLMKPSYVYDYIDNQIKQLKESEEYE